MAQNYLNRGFWGDEAWTSLISQLPYLQMLKTTAADFHPPGYYTVVELIYKILPANEIGTRLISIFFWWLTVWMVFILARKFKGQMFGLISALVVAINPIFFTYAFEARNYTMFAFSATASIYFLLKTLENFSKKNVFLYVVFTTLGIYTHYYMFFVLASQGLFVLLFETKKLLKMFIPWFLMLVLYLPWIPFLLGQLTSVSQSYWIGGIDEKTHFEAILRILSGEFKTVFQPFLFGLSILLILLGIAGVRAKDKFDKRYFLILLWAFVPFVLATLPGLKVGNAQLPFRPIFFWRYLIEAAIPFSIIMVWGAQMFRPTFFKTIIGLVLVLSLGIDIITWQGFPKTFKQVFENEVTPKIGQGDKIVTVLPSFAEVLYYRNYFGLTNEVVVLPEGLVQSSGKSLLDVYVENGTVKISDRPEGRYFELLRDSSNSPKAMIVTNDQLRITN